MAATQSLMQISLWAKRRYAAGEELDHFTSRMGKTCWYLSAQLGVWSENGEECKMSEPRKPSPSIGGWSPQGGSIPTSTRCTHVSSFQRRMLRTDISPWVEGTHQS